MPVVWGSGVSCMGPGLFSCQSHPNLYAAGYMQHPYCCTADSVLTACQSCDGVAGVDLYADFEFWTLFSVSKSRARLLYGLPYTREYMVLFCSSHSVCAFSPTWYSPDSSRMQENKTRLVAACGEW